MRSATLLGCLAALLLLGCGEEEPAEEPDGPGPPPQSCFAPEGSDGQPQDVEAFVDLVNALPSPVTIPCLLQTLARPLEINATSNTFSAQPAFGPNNPRIFIWRGDMVVAVVPKGEARPLVELSLLRTPGRSLKAELAFPVDGPLDHAAPYERLTADDPTAAGTKCGFCHFDETLDDSVDFADAYISDVVLPSPQDVVDLDYLTWAWETCDRELEADRCAVFDSIFAYGEVVWRDFD